MGFLTQKFVLEKFFASQKCTRFFFASLTKLYSVHENQEKNLLRSHFRCFFGVKREESR
jgi:hypothetical protein